MNTNYNFITLLFSSFVSQNKFVDKAIVSFDDQRSTYYENIKIFPALYCVIRGVNLNEYTINWNLDVYFLDLLLDNRSNEVSVMNNTLEIVNQFQNFIHKNKDNGYTIVNFSSLTPLNNFDNNRMNGWRVNMTLETKREQCFDATNPIIPNPPFVCGNGIVTLNNNVWLNVEPNSNSNINIVNQNQQLITPLSFNDNEIVIEEGVCNPVIWQRNPEWLTIPNIEPGDAQFFALFAVIEDDPGLNTINIQFDPGILIDWGDGTTDISSIGSNVHSYDYNDTFFDNQPILQLPDGRNYKQALISIQIGSTSIINLSSGVGTQPIRVQNLLDVVTGSPVLITLNLSQPTGFNESYCPFLQRVWVTEMSTTVVNNHIRCAGAFSLRVFDIPNFECTNLNATLQLSGNGYVRKNDGSLIDIISDKVTDMRNFNGQGEIYEFGYLDLPEVTQFQNAFNTSNLRRIGHINIPKTTEILNSFTNTKTPRIHLTVGTPLTVISSAFQNNRFLQELIIDGDMSSVVNINPNTFQNVTALYKLILTNIRVSFDIRSANLYGDNLEDLFQSLGTAIDNNQSITLAGWTMGWSAQTAIDKGWNIIYV